MKRALFLGWLVAGVAMGCGDDSNGTGGTAGTAGTSGTGGSSTTAIDVAGMPMEASVYFGADGMLHADCKTDEDCAAALGYFHARDRFVQMDLRRRLTTARLSGMLSTLASLNLGGLNADIENRALYSTPDGMPTSAYTLSFASEKTRALFDAYAAGVNAWIADVKAGRNGAVFPREFENTILFDYDASRIPDWTAEDCVATVLALIESLTNNSEFEIDLGRERARYAETFGLPDGELMFRDVFSTRPDTFAPVLNDFLVAENTWNNDLRTLECRDGNPMALASLNMSRMRPSDFVDFLLSEAGSAGGFGSHNWIVAPSKSASGNALLSNDPHLSMTNPATWYLAHLDSKTNGEGTMHVAGVTFAGLPFVIIGQNENLAWGATTTNFDQTDVYIETLNGAGDAVMFQGNEVPIIDVNFDIPISDGTTRPGVARFVPHHGPILPGEEGDPVMSLKWTGSNASTDVNFLTELATASTVDEARMAATNVTTLGQNWVFADTAGNIGWFPYNKVPKRTWATGYDPMSGTEAIPWMPLDGSGDYEWDEYFSYEELPQAYNPAAGYLATANNDMTGALADGDPTNDGFSPFQTDVAPGWREKRIWKCWRRTAHTPTTMFPIVSDTGVRRSVKR
ncbi:MAG: penicillin acylase family protein [Polyangiales bacterium]